jgi:hypothetical protein
VNSSFGKSDSETEDEIPSLGAVLEDLDDEPESELEGIIREIVGIEREMFFERRGSKTERQKKIREVIERHTVLGAD